MPFHRGPGSPALRPGEIRDEMSANLLPDVAFSVAFKTGFLRLPRHLSVFRRDFQFVADNTFPPAGGAGGGGGGGGGKGGLLPGLLRNTGESCRNEIVT